MKKILLSWIIISFNIFSYQPTEKLESIFNNVFNHNGFHGTESISGPGSSLEQTAYIRAEIPKLIRQYNIKSIFDAPCGDWNWISKVSLPIDNYIGADIVKILVEKNNNLYAKENYIFLHMNVVVDELPKVDLILCRDLLVHFSYNNIQKFFQNIKKSGSTYILMTHFLNEKNIDIRGDMDWRPLDFQNQPFNFPSPLEIIIEANAPEGWKHKTLSLWKVEDIPDFSY